MDMHPSGLALFWAAVIAGAILLYVILDGYDLGVGILFGTTRDEAQRARMMDAIAPFWDGNETWLVITGAVLFAAFPQAYAVFLGAFYFPVLVMLFGLIFRGLAFEFRFRSERRRWLWDLAFFVGSILVAFAQGAAVGAMIKGVPVANGQYAGGVFGWLSPFSILTGIGLVLGYALLGAGWLVLKCEGALHDWAHERIRGLAAGVFAVLFIAFSLSLDYSKLARSSMHEKPWAFALPLIGTLALGGIIYGVGEKRDWPAFAMACVFFLASFLTLGVMFWPYMIPFSVTVADAAAPDASLAFLFYGAGLLVLPIVVAYTVGEYWIFRGKIRKR